MIELEQTADGSNTLFVPELNEHYHSVKGALTESEHIFIRMGLEHHPSPSPHILEIGFGTGLNAFLTLLAAGKSGRTVYYTTLERYPITPELANCLAYPEQISPEHATAFRTLHTAPWEKDVPLTLFFTLHKVQTDFTTYTFPDLYDIIYFDAFAPEKQPEMWSPELFTRLFTHLNPGGILTTYCAKGIVRRTLQAAGFTVERLPGPPEGKREILRASKRF